VRHGPASSGWFSVDSPTADQFRHRDRAALDQLSQAELVSQCKAREALYEHVRGIWEHAKDDKLNPAIHPEWTAVAALCDLTRDLWSTAVQARLECLMRWPHTFAGSGGRRAAPAVGH
jgi:hypothetical protein